MFRESAEIGGIYRDTILDFKFWSVCDVKEWNSEYLELLEKTKNTQYDCEYM